MTAVVAIGNPRRLAGYALAGAEIAPGTDPEAAWDALSDDTVLVLLTPETHAQLERRLAEHEERLWVVLP